MSAADARRLGGVPRVARPANVPDGPPAAASHPGAGLLVGECTASQHATLPGRARIRFTSAHGVPEESWLPTLGRVSLRAGDKVLLGQPGNSPEGVVLGVLEGAATSPRSGQTPARTLELLPHESITIVNEGGAPLVEISRREAGPLLRVLAEDLSLDVPGKLRLSGASIEPGWLRRDLEVAPCFA